MNANTKERLIDAGWSLERQIDVDEVIDTLNSRGFLLTDKNFNPLKAIGKNLYKESLEYLEDEYDIEGINTVIPIGENDNRNMLILCTGDNVFYGYTDGCLVKYGNTIEEMLDCVIGENIMPEYID